MTALTLVPGSQDISRPEVRPGSRADRLSRPRAVDTLKQVAERNGVCVRPLAIRRVDTQTGRTDIIEVPCGATLSSKCKPCAERARRLRIQQIREGWHLTEEPTVQPGPAGDDALALVRLRAHLEFGREEAIREADFDQIPGLDETIADVERALSASGLRGHLTPANRTAKERKKRSTKRRNDVGDLPRLPVENRTVGRVYAGRDGRQHQPSTLLTLTLGSHGPVHTANRRGTWIQPCPCGQQHTPREDILGTPIDPDSYDYRSAALDAIHFARLIDRFWQNTRRAAGWKVQYAGAVELQRRLAPHAHFAVRGSIPRKLLKAVAAATYHQVWWPPHNHMTYTPDRPPMWDEPQAAYVDPKTGHALATWDEAIAQLEAGPDAEPAYVARLGSIDPREIKGVEAGSKDAERCVRYVTKYVTKDLAATAGPRGQHAKAHFDRLHAELAVLPCSPTCANWLLYNVQPKDAKRGLVPGRCKGKVHQRETLGFTGRRVLVSRQWSGKTLTDHRADNRDWIKAILAETLTDGDGDQGETPADPGRYLFEPCRPNDPDLPPLQYRLLNAISTRDQWRKAIARARQQPAIVSAIQDLDNRGRAA